MIAALMLYSIAVTLLLGVAAAAAEHLLRLARRPARAIWIAAAAFASVLCIARIVSRPSEKPPEAGVQTVATPTSIILRYDAGAPKVMVPISRHADPVRHAIANSPVPIVSGSAITRLDRPLLIAWIILSLIGGAIVAVSTLRVMRPHRRWTSAVVDGVPVLVSHDLGPAVVGALRYHIVLPEWVLKLSARERDLILTHEREHAAAGDPLLLLLAMTLIVLMPWNGAMWWMARRLRFAIELDCDARVLRRLPDSQAYGSLLLDISERTLGGAIPIAALAEPVSLIERRIAAMTARLPRYAAARAVASAAMAVALIVVACVAPRPASVPAPIAIDSAVQQPPLVRAPAQAVTPSLYHEADSLLALLKADTARLRQALPATDSAYNDSLRSELIALRRQVSDLETELARQSSSNAAIASNHGDQASTAYQQRGVTAGPIGTPRTKTVVASARVGATGIGASVGGAATAPLGSVDSTYPRVALDERTLGASVTRDSANWNRLHPPTVIVSSISGGAVSNRITPATNSTAAASNLSDRPVVSGDICGKTSAGDASVRTKGSTFMIRAPIEDHLDFRVRSAFREVVKSCPRAFEPHDGTMYVFVFLLDSTGHVTNISINTRRAMKPGETIQDRAALKIGMPDVPITSLYEWGMVDVSTLEQRRGSGVMVMYGFTGILH